ncbi:conserved protein, unknown function [Hepatocystis sp. ex Piliocolobus tephrosceles]|nr:conserved protein, unknown function [Hepatocystis sp. ex Piliocolobus tephrosceles]
MCIKQNKSYLLYTFLIISIFNIKLREGILIISDLPKGMTKFSNNNFMNKIENIYNSKLMKSYYKQWIYKYFYINNKKKKKKKKEKIWLKNDCVSPSIIKPFYKLIKLVKIKKVNNFLTPQKNLYNNVKRKIYNKGEYQLILNKLIKNLKNNMHNYNKRVIKNDTSNITNFLIKKKILLFFFLYNLNLLHYKNRSNYINKQIIKKKIYSLYNVSNVNDGTKKTVNVTSVIATVDSDTVAKKKLKHCQKQLYQNIQTTNDKKNNNSSNNATQVNNKIYNNDHNNSNYNNLNNQKIKKKRILSDASRNNMKEKLRLIMINKWKNPDFRKKMMKSFKKRGIEHNKKISEAVKKKWDSDKNYKAKTLEGQRKYFIKRYRSNSTTSISNKTKEKISKSMKLYWLQKNKYKQNQNTNVQSVIKKKQKQKQIWDDIYSIILNQQMDGLNNPYQNFDHNLSINLQAALS